mmetsp:Transcript_11322/g.20809  ORF Transcript_11322/g.20809 Transcript_11322/m.20809 type:complete len:400 (-) Transcript_11322:121-1320(-)|eukprot:CAMPEP_0201941088 /NCGR_PEP_ID=MMETSP0903-20130614/46488_1 /ASSEMBLY_ACC=CAM_ASM_000552 /TAXON_ID=420261 /ORGANISM="Thalassiosira antarctica, Strain CCMP982" /LENGTH=399 /DNA_ID=CAMNT_0048483057 /DNA_START=30 /DNA_END=1232 /DNA_ORIENTATION=+
MSNEAKIPEDNMTPTEREQWLRERGVLIETVNDRREAESILSGTTDSRPLNIVEQVQRLSINNDDVSGEGIKFVYIPHDTSQPISTINLPKRLVDALGPAGDIIPTYVKAFFADGKSIDETLFKDQAGKQNLLSGDIEKFAAASSKDNQDKSSPANPAAKLTSAAITNAAAGGSVETFPLVRPSSTNNHRGVSIYLDEVGLLKHLPNNKRASTLAQQCGFVPAPNFYGDVFVGRVLSKNSLHNIDIEKEDIIDSTKEWLRRAPHENTAWQQTLNEVTGRKGEVQPNHAGTEGVAVQVESKDGDKGCSYTWIQNGEEVELTVHLSKKVGEGQKVNKAMIKVAFQLQKITVKYDKETVLEVKVYSKLDVDGCTWTLDKGNLVVTGEKASEGEIWPRLELSG